MERADQRVRLSCQEGKKIVGGLPLLHLANRCPARPNAGEAGPLFVRVLPVLPDSVEESPDLPGRPQVMSPLQCRLSHKLLIARRQPVIAAPQYL
jgi:hypothetical protein